MHVCWEHLSSAAYDRRVEVMPAEKGATCEYKSTAADLARQYKRCGNPAPFMVADKVLLAIIEAKKT